MTIYLIESIDTKKKFVYFYLKEKLKLEERFTIHWSFSEYKHEITSNLLKLVSQKKRFTAQLKLINIMFVDLALTVKRH